jgi:hypothetical protein
VFIKTERCHDKSSCGSWKPSSTAWTSTITASSRSESFRDSLLSAPVASAISDTAAMIVLLP